MYFGKSTGFVHAWRLIGLALWTVQEKIIQRCRSYSERTLPLGSQIPRYLVVQSLSHVWLFVTAWTAAHQASLSFTISWSLLRVMPIVLMIPSNHLILYGPLLLLASMVPSIRVFSSESALCTRWPKYWSFNFSISSSREYSGLISFRIDWFDLLAVQVNS